MAHPVLSICLSWHEIIAEKDKYICVNILLQGFKLVDIESPEASHSLLSIFSASIIIAQRANKRPPILFQGPSVEQRTDTTTECTNHLHVQVLNTTPNQGCKDSPGPQLGSSLHSPGDRDIVGGEMLIVSTSVLHCDICNSTLTVPPLLILKMPPLHLQILV